MWWVCEWRRAEIEKDGYTQVVQVLVPLIGGGVEDSMKTYSERLAAGKQVVLLSPDQMPGADVFDLTPLEEGF